MPSLGEPKLRDGESILKRMEDQEMPKELLVEKLKEHQGVIMCPYCKNLFDVHVGMVFLEGKQSSPQSPQSAPGYAYQHFEEIMGEKPTSNES